MPKLFNHNGMLETLHWRHNGRDGVSNHQRHDCLLNGLFRRRSNNTSKLCVTGLWEGSSPGPVNYPHRWPVTRKCFHLITSSWFYPFRAASFWGNTHIYLQLYHFSISSWRRWLESYFIQDKDPFISHSQYHGYWWPGDSMSQSTRGPSQ